MSDKPMGSGHSPAMPHRIKGTCVCSFFTDCAGNPHGPACLFLGWCGCDDDTQCTDTGFCNHEAGRCIADQGLALTGEACVDNTDCESGICADEAGNPNWVGGYCLSNCTQAWSQISSELMKSSNVVPL